MILKIVGVKNPILRKKSKPVTKLDKKITKLIADMKETLEAQDDPEGVGLAAPQVGKNLQIFVMKYKNLRRVIINPKVISKSQKSQSKTVQANRVLEGCLSLPHYYGPLKRASKIKIRYKNEEGKKVTEEFTGFHAQIVEHEIDHLNGIVFIDRILSQDSPLYKFDGEAWEEVTLA